MIDYIFTYPDEATAHAVLNPAGFGNPRTASGWDEDIVLTVKVQVGEEQTGEDENGDPIMQPIYAAGYWLVISPPNVREDIWQTPGCMREADREANMAGEPYVLRDRFTAEQLATPWKLNRQWSGCDYSNPGK